MTQYPAQVRREYTGEDKQLRSDGGPKSLYFCVRGRYRVMPSQQYIGPMGVVVELGREGHQD